MYADDTNLFLQGSDISEVESTFNTEISKVTDWIKANKLSLNVKKTHSMIFSCTSSVRNKIVNVSFDNVCVDTVSCTRFLGVLLDNRLSWDQQIQHVCNKISKCTGVMKKASRVLLRDTLLQLYYIFVYPYDVYCNIIWGSAAKTNLSKIFILQKKIIRIMHNLGVREHTQSFFRERGILNIFDLYNYNVCMFMFRYHHCQLPNIFDGIFETQDSVHHYVFRSATRQLYVTKYCRTNLRQNTFIHNGPRLWNALVITHDLDTCLSKNVFKCKLKNILMNNLHT